MTIFKVGDVVRLKSGGEPFTVTQVNQDETLEVAWRVRERIHQLTVPVAAMEFAPGFARESASVWPGASAAFATPMPNIDPAHYRAQ